MEKQMSEDRKRQVETTKARHGEDYYSKISDQSPSKSRFKDSNLARLAALKRFHPDWFDSEGNLIEGKGTDDGGDS